MDITGLIPVVTPVVIWAIRLAVPKIPKMMLPILAPLVGAAADIAAYYAGLSGLAPLWGALLGAVGVWLRELVDQAKKALGPSAALGLLLVLAAGTLAGAATPVTATRTQSLAWDPVTTAEDGLPATIVEYRVYLGTASGTYAAPTPVGTATRVTLASLGITASGTYYAAVTAVDAQGRESRKSAELAVTVSVPPPQAPAALRIE